MKSNNTEIFFNKPKFISNTTEKYINNKTEYNLQMKANKSLNEFKINQELKSLPEDFRNTLKRGLSKHKLTSEVYIPKNISLGQKYNKDLLIEKVKNYNKFIFDRHKLASKLANDTSSFSKVYNYIKELEGKKNRQQQYFDEIEKIYLEKDYNLKNCAIKKGENIFDYSMLIDKCFGDNVKQDAIRLINEINNKDLLKEHKLVFKLNNEIIEQKLKNKLNNRSKKLLKNMMNKNEYLKMLKARKDMKNVTYKRIKKKPKKNKTQIKELKKGVSFNGLINTEDNYIDNQLKNNIKRIEENLENIKHSYQSEDKYSDPLLAKINNLHKTLLGSDIDLNNKDKHNNIISYRFSTDLNNFNNFKPINLYKKKNQNQNQNNSEMDISRTNTNLSEKIENVEVKKINPKNIKNKLPKINKSFEELANLNLSSSTTTNCSFDKIKKSNTHIIGTPKENNKSAYKNIFNINNNEFPKRLYDFRRKSESFNQLTFLKKLKERKSSNNDIVPYLKMFIAVNGNKKILNENELNYHFSKFQDKNNFLLETFRNKKLKETNLHGFVSNFQRVAESRSFGTLSEKNKYLKKNNYSNLISNFNDTNDELDAMSIKEIDNRISNIYYDLADLILNNHISHK